MKEARVLTPQNFDDIDDTTTTYDQLCGMKPLFDYIQGWDKPHYPVPAVIYHVDMGSTGVAVWNNSVPYTDADYFTMKPDLEFFPEGELDASGRRVTCLS